MNRRDWLNDAELADPDTAVVSHIVGWWHHWLGWIMPGTLRALCGDDLRREDDSADPGPDSPVCARCAVSPKPATRLLTAYRNLCDKNRALAYVALLGLVIDSLVGLLVTAIWAPRWAPLPALILTVAVLLLRAAPDDDESDPDS